MTDIPQLPAHILDGIDWVWFDLDDTLYDFRANSHTSLAETYRIASLQRWWPSVDEWRDHYHRINDELWELYAPGLISQAGSTILKTSIYSLWDIKRSQSSPRENIWKF